MVTYDHDNVRYHAGNGLEVGCLYPMCQQQAFFEGMKSAGEKEIITLGRAGLPAASVTARPSGRATFIRHGRICSSRCAPD